MKSYKGVDANRRSYHQDGARNSVHRSSLTVPEIEGSSAEISFLNHFLIKRKYERVGCRITAIDPDGERIESRLFSVTEPKAYTVPLSGTFDTPVDTYMVEFFAADNLFIPFPAVMVNHVGDQFINSVHSYNRILNDVFEDDHINRAHVAEASIDVRTGPDVDTFALFTAGPQRCVGDLDVELNLKGTVHRGSIALDVPRFTNRYVSVKEIFPALGDVRGGILKITQPKQPMFYGRMLAGRHASGAFSGNHSYYDSSGTSEYWDTSDDSFRTYPILSGIDTYVRIYPHVAASRLQVFLDGKNNEGLTIGTIMLGELTSPGNDYIDANVLDSFAKNGISGISSFVLRARPLAGAAPTRIGHQIVYGDPRSPLEASINVALSNPQTFSPAGKGSLVWGQVALADKWRSRLALVRDPLDDQRADVVIDLFSQDGQIDTVTGTIAAGGSLEIDLDNLSGSVGDRDATHSYLWYMARSSLPGLSAFSITQHADTGHTTGEHNF